MKTEHSSARAAFHYRDFRFYQASKFLFTVGWLMQGTAVGYQIYEITRDPLSLGLIGLYQFLPAVCLALVTGQVADRFDRRRVVMLCQAVLVCCSLGFLTLTILEVRVVWPFYVLLAVIGAGHAFSGPASQALLPHLVPKEHFPNAVAWNSSIWQMAAITGPSIGGVLYAWQGARTVYMVDAATCCVAMVCMFLVRTRTGRMDKAAVSWDTVLAGIRYVWRRKVILGAVSLDLFAVLFGGAVALMPVFARDILNVGALGNGWLRAAPAVGAAITAILLAHMPPMKRAGATMFWCVAGFGVATIIFGVSRSFPLSLLALFALGAFDMISVVVRHTLVQVVTPHSMRGRVSAVNLIFIGASNELGQFESGVTAKLFGSATTAVIVGGIGTLLVVALWSWLFPDLRKFGRLDADMAKDPELPEEEEART